MEGRDNQTPGSMLAQDHLIDQLRAFAEPMADDFRQPFAEGTNIVGLIPGGELAAGVGPSRQEWWLRTQGGGDAGGFDLDAAAATLRATLAGRVWPR